MKLQAIVVHSVRRVVIGPIAVALVTLAIQLSADAADNPNTSWYQEASFSFKPGKTTEALQIIHEHFRKVEKAIGRKVMPLDQRPVKGTTSCTSHWILQRWRPFRPKRSL